MAYTGVIGAMAGKAIDTGGIQGVGALLVAFHRGVGQFAGTYFIAAALVKTAGGSSAPDGPGAPRHNIITAYIPVCQLTANAVVHAEYFGIGNSRAGVYRVGRYIGSATPGFPANGIARTDGKRCYRYNIG